MIRSFSFTKALLGLAGLFVLLVACGIKSEAAPVKRVLLEQHTGAWCGWCVDGSYVVDELYKKYPDQMIGVKLHNGDKMVIPAEGELGTFFGLTGYPSATIDRKPQGSNYLIDRGSWQSVTEALMKEAPLADISVTQVISNDTLYATVKAEALADIPKQLAMSLFVCEDYVTGTVTGYDQSNYLSGRAGYEDNPYYKLPSTIKGYKHMAVVRALLGGSFGDKSKFPAAGVKKGDKFEQTFTFVIPSTQNKATTYCVAAIQENGGAKTSSAILNCAATPRNLLKDAEITVVNDKYNWLNSAKEQSYEYTIKNANDFDIPVGISVNTKTSILPATWDVKLSATKATVPAKGEVKLTVSVKGSADAADFAAIKLDIKNNYTGAGYLPVDATCEVNALSNLTKNVIWTGTCVDPSRFTSVFTSDADAFAKTASVPLSADAIGKYAKSFDLEVFQANFFSSTFYGNTANDMAARQEITNALAAGKKIFIANEVGVSMNTSYRTLATEAKNWFTTLGITKKSNMVFAITLDANGYITGLVQHNVKGIATEFTKDLDLLINYDDQDMTNKTNFLDNIKVATPSVATMNIVNETGSATNTVGFKYDNGKEGRLAYYGFTLESLEETPRTQLINTTVNWLFGKVDVKDNAITELSVVPNPISSSAKVSYSVNDGDVKVFAINSLGEKVADLYNGFQTAGSYSLNVNSTNMASGVYYIVVENNGVRRQIATSIVK